MSTKSSVLRLTDMQRLVHHSPLLRISAELEIKFRLADVGIGWSPELQYGISDAERVYQPQGPASLASIERMTADQAVQATRWTPNGFVCEQNIPCEEIDIPDSFVSLVQAQTSSPTQCVETKETKRDV
jgi:hypothetical protein